MGQLNQLQLTERQLNDRVEVLELKNSELLSEKQKKPKEVDLSYSQEVWPYCAECPANSFFGKIQLLTLPTLPTLPGLTRIH